MYRTLMLPALLALALTACKPTPRTANVKPRPAQQEQQETGTPATPPATAPTAEVQPAVQPPAPQKDATASLLSISSTRQIFSRLRPWEKEPARRINLMGVYLGQGRVLTCGRAASAATYVEISLPDGSRSAPARVLRYDRDLDLALLTLVHEEDAGIFDTREALVPGEALKLGDRAEFHGLVRGLIPVRIPLLAESNEVEQLELVVDMPRLTMRAAQPVPEGGASGLPIVRDGKLVALSSGYNSENQSLTCINGELIARFLSGEDGEHAGSPMVGIYFTGLDDPVFRRYLKLDDAQGGIYIKTVLMGSAAEQAGLQKGDVVTAIDGLDIDMQGRCQHPLYGALAVEALLRSYKPLGESLTFSISRDGQKQQLEVPLNRDVYEKNIAGSYVAAGEQPRYVMWGGLLFQPMTLDYIKVLMGRSNGSLPVQLLEMDSKEEELMEKGVSELVMLTQALPTPATLSYEGMGHSIVEKVNGREVHNFDEFVRLLDEPTPDGLVSLTTNKAPYTIHIDRRVAEAANSVIRRTAIHQLRHLGAQPEAPTEPEPAPAP